MPDGVFFPYNSTLVFPTIVEVGFDEYLDVLLMWGINVYDAL
jgi:hypothetical protein